jgi:hypothetical protein
VAVHVGAYSEAIRAGGCSLHYAREDRSRI